ncbi:Hypothetical protein NTJ_08897 [Nesidiocoris tenuis]|uniref:Uncharacterized protein n=1 Tax=Nesidiocoris tenuis TaxID=355587 RepID=A0ABN7AV86_9HEMI|nr:Hypothetical protein NTJ_08897 [Nesidiocoris tenuis]
MEEEEGGGGDTFRELSERLGGSEGGKDDDLIYCKGGSDSGVEENGVQGNAEGASCDSSLVLSYCNSSEELVSHSNQCDAAESEGGSESSSVASHPRNQQQSGERVHFGRHAEGRSSRSSAQQLSSAASRRNFHKERSLSRTPCGSASSSSRTPSTTRSGPNLMRSLSVRSSDSPGSGLRVTTPRSNRVRSPAVTPDDGRWPSTVSRSASKPKEKKSMTSSLGPSEGKLALGKCATLPRRRRKSADNLLSPPSEAAPSPRGRDLSLNRTASLRRKKLLESQMSTSMTSFKPSTPSGSVGLPKAKPSKGRTRIYHETAVQTSLTSRDMEAGAFLPRDVHTRVDTSTTAVQADRRMENVERLETELKDLQQKFRKLTLEKENTEKLKEELKRERERHKKQEERLRLLLPPQAEGDVVTAIEKEHNAMKEVCKSQQKEINTIQSFCCHVNKELDKSLKAQRKLLDQQQVSESESVEMHEFLLAENSTLSETVRELESEIQEAKKSLKSKETQLAQQQEECTHLVRMCEQRRQENLYLESRLRAVETCSKETMLVHGAAASGAAVALSGLGNRLEVLVEALVTAYEISPADLEDVVFHNEAFTLSSGSGSESSSGKTSPKPTRSGFVTAIINAIKAATVRSTPDTFSDADLLSAEPEPSAFFKDITLNSSPADKRHSITSLPSFSDVSPSKCSNRASYAASELDLELGGDPLPSESGITNSESLQNLSDAIIRRQKEEEESAREMATMSRSVQTGLVDQVIDVDNLITKLLKVMHLIQCKERTNLNDNEQKVSSNAIIVSLKKQIEALQEELKNSSDSSLQVENLQKALQLKEKELDELEKKYSLTDELLTTNWHKAMAEVRRQYEAVDRALDLLGSIPDRVADDSILSRVRQELEQTNCRSASTLPVSTSRPDLNANDTINDTEAINDANETQNLNGT